MDLVDSEPATGVQQELSRFGRVLDSFSRRIQAVERRLTHTEGCQQAQELEIHEMKHVVDKVLYSETGLSFWGGVSPKSGIIVDQRSCTGSQVILELLLNGNAPAAIVLCHTDEIIALGAIVAEELCNKKLPESAFKAMSTWRTATIDGSVLSREGQGASSASKEEEEEEEELQLSTSDQQMLSGSQGLARQKALSIVARMARLQGAAALIDVKQAHIDGCTYIGPASLKFAQKLLEWDAKVQVPTTLNAISVDLARRSEFPEELGGPAASLAEAGLRSAPGVCKFVAYLKIGARGSFTCAPYLLDSAPEKGDHIGWGESNAVVFANSVLGARTQKYADFLDACVAITGRAPLAGCHLERAAQVVLQVLAQSRSLGFGEQLEAFGAQLVSDTCWCMLGEVSKQEVLAKEAELSEGLVQLREQVRALIDFLAQAHVGARGFTGSDMEDKKEGVEHPAENLPSDGPRIAWQNAQSDANQRLRRVFSPPSFIPEPEKPTESKETKGADDSQGQKSSKSVRVCPPAPSESDGTEKTTPQAAETMRASRASAPPASAQRSVSCGGGAPGVGPAYHSLGSRPCVRVLSGQISPAPPHLNGASTPAPTGPTPKAVALSGPYFSGPGMVPMRCRTLSGGCRAFPESPNGWVFVF
eukprot:s4336_g6.t1